MSLGFSRLSALILFCFVVTCVCVGMYKLSPIIDPNITLFPTYQQLFTRTMMEASTSKRGSTELVWNFFILQRRQSWDFTKHVVSVACVFLSVYLSHSTHHLSMSVKIINSFFCIILETDQCNKPTEFYHSRNRNIVPNSPASSGALTSYVSFSLY